MNRVSGSQIGCLIMIIILSILYMLFIYYERYKLAGLYHYLVGTKDIKEPLVKEEFYFDKDGYERVYKIKPKYRGFYDIYIEFKNFDIEWGYLRKRCVGEIEIQYIGKLKVEKKIIIKDFIGYLGSRNYGDWINSIYLCSLIYYNDIFRNDIDSIKIKVKKPILCFPKGKDKKTYLVIRYTYNL